MIDPAAPGAGQDAYGKTATAACKLLGYETFGSGTVHMIGKSVRLSLTMVQVKPDYWRHCSSSTMSV